MKGVLLGLALFSFALYAWAIQHSFSRPHGIDRRMRLLQVSGTISALIHTASLAAATTVLPFRGIGASFLYGCGLLVFFCARRAVRGHLLTLAFSPDLPTELVSSGIYAYIRHPFYLAYALTWLAGLLAAPSVWTLVTTIAMITGYVYAARTEEAKFAQSSLSERYGAYKKKAGLMWPRLHAASRTGD
jgi:protein-S-isoprenylcysteine O-methyltransferase Ste14